MRHPGPAADSGNLRDGAMIGLKTLKRSLRSSGGAACTALTRPFRPNGGVAYTVALAAPPASGALLLLLEDGKPLGPGASEHAAIRTLGGGRFSLWNGVLYFSASDGSDCNWNGRRYELVAIDRAALVERLVPDLEQDDELLLRLITGNTQHINRFVNNFFQYFDGMREWMRRNGVDALPEAVLEIGSGARPYTGLRFLLEGTQRYVACDLFDIQSEFSPAFVEALRGACLALKPDLAPRFDGVFVDAGGAYRAAKLEAVGETSFDGIADIGTFDFIHSISVLEHVADPEATARKMADLLRPGGHMYHSIDFRDHRNFGRPLDFLELTEEQYRPIATENRIRASDWVGILTKSGFKIVERVDYSMAPESVRAGHATANASYRCFGRHDPIEPFVTEEMRARFAEPFRSKDLLDLSILSTHLFCRKN